MQLSHNRTTYSLLIVSIALILGSASCQPQTIPAVLAAPADPLPTTTPTSPPTASPLPSPTSLPSSTPVVSPTVLTPTPTLPPDPVEPTAATRALAPSAASCREAHGKIETHPLDAQEGGLSEFTIYLPPCYEPASPGRYPVLYMLHGLNSNDQQWVKIGAPAAADKLIHSGRARPFIIVMPKEDAPDLDPNQSPFEDTFINVLVPWIDRNYATCTDRVCRAIGGLSRGSGWALRIGLSHWQMFGAIGAHSVSPFDGDVGQLGSWLIQSTAEDHPRIYMDIGTYDVNIPTATSAEQILTIMRVPHQWHLFMGGHNESYWSDHISDYLAWYSEPWSTGG